MRVRFRELRQNFSLDPLLEFRAAIKETLGYLAQTAKAFFKYIFHFFKLHSNGNDQQMLLKKNRKVPNVVSPDILTSLVKQTLSCPFLLF